jgi:hypothetical protein
MLVWRHVGWRCIRPKPRSSTARTATEKGNYPNVSFDFLGYRFRPRRAENARTKQVFCNFLPAISQSALESMRATVRDLDIRRQTQVSMADYSATVRMAGQLCCRAAGRHRPADQSAPSGLDRVLRTVYALGIGTLPAICQSDATGLGYAEVQALEGSQDQGQAFSHAAGWGVPGRLRTLENR